MLLSSSSSTSLPNFSVKLPENRAQTYNFLAIIRIDVNLHTGGERLKGVGRRFAGRGSLSFRGLKNKFL